MPINIRAWPKERNRRENPYNYLVYNEFSDQAQVEEFDYRSFALKGADILHVHWPDRILDDKRKWRLVWRFNRFLKAVDKLQNQGGKLVWTVHNLHSREVQFPDTASQLLKCFIDKVDGFIFLSDISRELFKAKYSMKTRAVYAVIPHPHYRSVYQHLVISEARKNLTILGEKFVLGFFGKIRKNKGLETLISCLGDSSVEDIRLLIAGGRDKRGLSQQLLDYMENTPEALAYIRYIAPEEVGAIIGACNALIFPYIDILNSGSALLALSLNRPVIAPSVGSFPELQAQVGKDWVYLYEQPLDPKKLEKALAWAKNINLNNNNQPDLAFYDPAFISNMTEKFFYKVLGNREKHVKTH